MLSVQFGQRTIVRLFIAAVLLLVLVSGIAIGLVIRQLTVDAAPVSDITACVNRYTGAVRMSPYGGTTTCNSNEMQVVWPATQGATNYEIRGHTFSVPAGADDARSFECEPGEVVTGAGVSGSRGVVASGVPINDNSTVAGLPTGWSVSSDNTNATGFGQVFVGLICASTTP